MMVCGANNGLITVQVAYGFSKCLCLSKHLDNVISFYQTHRRPLSYAFPLLTSRRRDLKKKVFFEYHQNHLPCVKKSRDGFELNLSNILKGQNKPRFF